MPSSARPLRGHVGDDLPADVRRLGRLRPAGRHLRRRRACPTPVTSGTRSRCGSSASPPTSGSPSGSGSRSILRETSDGAHMNTADFVASGCATLRPGERRAARRLHRCDAHGAPGRRLPACEPNRMGPPYLPALVHGHLELHLLRVAWCGVTPSAGSRASTNAGWCHAPDWSRCRPAGGPQYPESLQPFVVAGRRLTSPDRFSTPEQFSFTPNTDADPVIPKGGQMKDTSIRGTSTTTHEHRSWRTLAATGLAVSVATIGTGMVSAAPAQASQAPIVIWVDAARVPQVKAYEKANPSVKLDVVTFDAGANGSGQHREQGRPVQPGRPRLAGHCLFCRGERRPKARPPAVQFPGGAQPREAPARAGTIKNYASGALEPVLRRRQARVPAQRPRLRRAVGQRPADEAVRAIPSPRPGSSGRRSARTWPRTTPAT